MRRKSPDIQYAALPYTLRDGLPWIMVITSRETRRWVIPKGWPMRGLPPCEVAAREAFEEAGLLGEVAPTPLAGYAYDKRLKSGKTRRVQVDVFLFQVTQELNTWPERKERERRWVTPGQAALMVDEPGLATILLTFGAPP